MSIDINNPDSIAGHLAAIRSQSVAVMNVPEHQATAASALPMIKPPAEQDRLTEKEAIQIVQKWATEDAEIELSERMLFKEMVERLREAAEVRGSDLSVSRLKEIVSKYAPNAQHGDVQQPKQTPVHPMELEPLIESGIAEYTDDVWLVKRCDKCGQFKTTCCGRITSELAVRDDNTLTNLGRQAVGLDPIKPPRPPRTLEQIKETWTLESWWNSYRSVEELEGNGTIKMYIENFLPEGATIICGLPKEGKSFLALSIAKALTSGKPLFGKPKFSVPEIVPVLYLAAESGDGALKLRCEKMGITRDKTKFIARTLSQGPMFGLDDENIRHAIRAMKPVVILETLIRFNDGDNEDSSTENRKLAEAIFRLIAWGAKAVIGIHHSRKDLNKASPTKEAAVRGSGDGLAMVDAVWLVMQDEKLHQRGKGPNQINVVGWGRDFNPVPMTLALTKKATKETPAEKLFAPGIVSTIDSAGDLEWVDKRIVFGQEAESADQIIEQLVIENPSISKKVLAERTKLSEWEIRNALKRLGYRREKGGKKGASDWIKVQS